MRKKINEENKIEIEYEEVTIKVPKQVMALLKFAEPGIEMTPKEWIEYHIVDQMQASIESGELLTPKALTDTFKLNPILEQITGWRIEN